MSNQVEWEVGHDLTPNKIKVNIVNRSDKNTTDNSMVLNSFNRI